MTNQYKEELMAEWKEFSTKYLGFSIDEAKDQEEIMSWWLQKIDEAVGKEQQRIGPLLERYFTDFAVVSDPLRLTQEIKEFLGFSTPTNKVN